MAYKMILVHVDQAQDLEQRVQLAAQLAASANEDTPAQVIGLAVTGVSPFLSALTSPLTKRMQAGRSLAQFNVYARQYGIDHVDSVLLDGDAATAIAEQGKQADLIILGKESAQLSMQAAGNDFAEYIMLNSSAPVLIVNRKPCLWKHALIAWNNSPEASHAVLKAVPLLQAVEKVSVVIFGSAAVPGVTKQNDLQACLSALQKEVDVIHRPVTSDAGHALIELGEELGADLLVMGCIAHPRWREVMPGGTTGIVLGGAETAVLMSR